MLKREQEEEENDKFVNTLPKNSKGPVSGVSAAPIDSKPAGTEEAKSDSEGSSSSNEADKRKKIMG